MRNGLRLAPNLTLPLESVTETIGIVGIKGSGKTTTSKVITEEMCNANIPVCVLDPLGVWFGLRSSASGTDTGLPFVILGGDHGDVPLESPAGEVIADFVIEEAGWTVLDLSHFRKAEMRRFVTAFLTRLYHKNRHPLHVVLDEADLFAPQRPSGGRGEVGNEASLLGAVEDLIRRGRARGLGATLITQRPAVLHKDVLTQISTLIAHRLSGPQDRNALDAWVSGHGSKDQRDEMMANLASLPTGTAWFWSPSWLDIFKQVAVRKSATFDSSATPGRGQARIEPRVRADVDLERLSKRMVATIERAKAEDPRELRLRIADLQRQLAVATSATPVAPEIIEVEVIPPGLSEALRNICADIESLETAARDSHQALGKLIALTEKTTTKANTQPAFRAPAKAPPRTVAKVATTSGEHLPGPQRKLLTVLALYGPRTKQQLAMQAGYVATGGAFRNPLSALRSAGYVHPGEPVTITDAGAAALGSIEPLPVGPQLIADWMSRLSGPCRKILAAVIDRPTGWDNDELAEACGYVASGGAFRNPLSKLRTLGLVAKGTPVRLTDEFAEAIR